MEDESTTCSLDLYIETLDTQNSSSITRRSPLHANENSNATFDIYSDLDMFSNLPEANLVTPREFRNVASGTGQPETDTVTLSVNKEDETALCASEAAVASHKPKASHIKGTTKQENIKACSHFCSDGDSKHQQTSVVGFPASLSGRSSENLPSAKSDVPATSEKASKKSSLGQELEETKHHLSVWQKKFKELEKKYITLNKNMLSLLLTARQEVKKKDSLIAQLRANLDCKGSSEDRTSDKAVNTDLSGPVRESTAAQSAPSRCLFSSSASAKTIFISSPNMGDSLTNNYLPSNVLPKEGAITDACQNNSEPTAVPDNSKNMFSSNKDCNLGLSKNVAAASLVPRSSTSSLSVHISQDESGLPPAGSPDISAEIIHIASRSAITSTSAPLAGRAHRQTDDSECVLFDNTNVSLPVLSSFSSHFSKPIDGDGFNKLQLESKSPKNATAGKLGPPLIHTKLGSSSTYSGGQIETDLIITEKPEETNIVGCQEERKDLCTTAYSEKFQKGSAKVETINKDVSEPHRCSGQDVHHNSNLDELWKKKDCMSKDKDKNANLSQKSSSQPGEVHRNTVKKRNLQVFEDMHAKVASSQMVRDQKKFSRKNVQENTKYFCEESAKIQINNNEHAEKEEKRESQIENKFKSSSNSQSDSSKDRKENKENLVCSPQRKIQSKQKNEKMFLQKSREGKKCKKRKKSEEDDTVKVTDLEFTQGRDVKSKLLEEKGNLTVSSQYQDASDSNTAINLVDSNNFENKSNCTSEMIVAALVPSVGILEEQCAHGAFSGPCVIQASGTSNEQVHANSFQENGQKRVQVENEVEKSFSLTQKHFSVASDDNHLNHIWVQGAEASLAPDSVKVSNKTNFQNAASSDRRHCLLDTVIVSGDLLVRPSEESIASSAEPFVKLIMDVPDLDMSVSTDTSDESSVSDNDIPFVEGANTLQCEKEVGSKMDGMKKVICSKNRKNSPHTISTKKICVADKTPFSCTKRMEVSSAKYSLGSSIEHTHGSAVGDSNLHNLAEVHKTAGSIVWSPDKSIVNVSKLHQPISSQSFDAFLGMVENSVTSTCTKPARKMLNVKILDESSFMDDEAARDITCFLNFAKRAKSFSQESILDVSQVGISKNGSSTSSAQLVFNSHKAKSATNELGVYENTTDCSPAMTLDTFSLFGHPTVQTSAVPSAFSESSFPTTPLSPSVSKKTSLLRSSEESIASSAEPFVKLIMDVPDLDMQQKNRTEDVDDLHAASKQFIEVGSRGSKVSKCVSKLQHDRNQPKETACKSESPWVDKSGLRDSGDRQDKEQRMLGDRIKQTKPSCVKPDITQPGKPGSTAKKGQKKKQKSRTENLMGEDLKSKTAELPISQDADGDIQYRDPREEGENALTEQPPLILTTNFKLKEQKLEGRIIQCEKQSIKGGNSKLQDPVLGARCGSTKGRKQSAYAPSVASKAVESKCCFDVKKASVGFNERKQIQQICNVEERELKSPFQKTAVVPTKPGGARLCDQKKGEIESLHTSLTNSSSPPDKSSFSSFKRFSPEKGELVIIDGMQDRHSCSYLSTVHPRSSVCDFSWPEDAPFEELRENLLHKKRQNTKYSALGNKREQNKRVTGCVGEGMGSRVTNSSGSRLVEDKDICKDKKLKIVTALSNSCLPNVLQVSVKDEQMNVLGKEKTYSRRSKRHLSLEPHEGMTIKKARPNSRPSDKQTPEAGGETEKYDDSWAAKSDVRGGFIVCQAKLHLLPKHIQERPNPSSSEIHGSAEAGSSCVQHVEASSLIRNSWNHAATSSEDSNNEGKDDQEEEGEAAKSEELDDSFIVVDSETSNDGPVAGNGEDTTTCDDPTVSGCARMRVYVSKIRAALSENESACCSKQPDADDCDSDRKSKELDGNSKITRTDDHQRASNMDPGEDMKELLAERESLVQDLVYSEEAKAVIKKIENLHAADSSDFILEDDGVGRVLDTEFIPLETEREGADKKGSGQRKDGGDCIDAYSVEKEEGLRLVGSEIIAETREKGRTGCEFKPPKGISEQAADNEDDDKRANQRKPEGDSSYDESLDYFFGVASGSNKPSSGGEGEERVCGASRQQVSSEQMNEKHMVGKIEDCGSRLISEKDAKEQGPCDLLEEQVRLKEVNNAQKDDDGGGQKDDLTLQRKDYEKGECFDSDSTGSEDEVGRKRIWAERGKRWESVDCLSLSAGAESLGYLDELGVEPSWPHADHAATSKKHDAKGTRNFRLDTSLRPSPAQGRNVARSCNEKSFSPEPIPRNGNSHGQGRQSGGTSSISINNVPDRTLGDKVQPEKKPKYRQRVSSGDCQDQHRRLKPRCRPQERRHDCGARGGGCFDTDSCRRSQSSACGCRRHDCDHDEQGSDSRGSRTSCLPRVPRHSERGHLNHQLPHQHRYSHHRQHRDCSCGRRERDKPATSSKGFRSNEGQGRDARLVHGKEFPCQGEKCRCCAEKYTSGCSFRQHSVGAARSRSRSPVRCRGRDCHCGLERHHGESSSRRRSRHRSRSRAPRKK